MCKRIALTFDDGPDSRVTFRVLDILKQSGTKATFFCVGSQVEKHPEIVRRIHNEGHLVAIHSYEHDWHIHLWDTSRVHRSILKTGSALQKITGFFPRFLRTPVGIKTPAEVVAAHGMGLIFIGWTRRAFDGGGQTLTMERTQKIISRVKGGDIILLHDGKLGANGEELDHSGHYSAINTLLPEMIGALKAKDLDFVTLDHLLGLPRHTDAFNSSVHPYRYESTMALFRTLMHSFAHAHASPLRLSCALGIGAFIGCSPFWGLHTFLGLVTSMKLRLSRIAVTAGTNISNPVTGLFVIIACIEAGWRTLHGSWLTMTSPGIHTESFIHLGNQVFTSWLIGFPIVGSVAGLCVMSIAYLLSFFYRSTKKEPC